MKKKILKIAIGIVAVPTVAFGTLYAAREIPVVSEKVVMPLAEVSESIGLPVLVRPKISEETMRQCIGNLKYIYYVQKSDCQGEYPNHKTDTVNQWLEKLGCVNPETKDLQNIKAVNNQEGFGTEFFILLYSENQGYNMTWREFLEAHLRVVELRVASEEDIQRCLQLDLEENIPMNDPSVTNSDDDGIFGKYQKRIELLDQQQEAMKNGDNEKIQQIQQQLDQLDKEIDEYEKANGLITEINPEIKQEVENFNNQFSEVELTYDGIKDLIDKVKANNMNTQYYIEINEEALTDENKEYSISKEYGGINGRINKIIIYQK